MTISIEHADAPGVVELLQLSDDFHAALYPPDQCYMLNVDELRAPNVTIAVAREDGTALGMAALVEKADYAEVKRMYLREEARGRGLADGILQSLEQVAREHGVRVLQLETGPLQPAAIGFYERNGFSRIPNFGEYVGDEVSVCFGKTLD